MASETTPLLLPTTNNNTANVVEPNEDISDASSENTVGGVETVTKKRTPLPAFQLLLVNLIQVGELRYYPSFDSLPRSDWISTAEPINATVIYPYINQFIRETGVINGDERKTGYYAGIVVRLYLTSFVYLIDAI
jgi:hypothetical protein